MEETLEQMQARHRKEQRDLQSRITSKKKNATKKTRKGVNDECAELERQLKEKQAEELQRILGGGEEEVAEDGDAQTTQEPTEANGTADLAQQLKDTHISPEPSPPQQPEAQAQGQGGKKRNRQKERLARRAAEQEAAALEAEKEASKMVDHRGIEKAYMMQTFKTHDLTEKDIAPDGHCLFSAVADQLNVNGVPVSSGVSGPLEEGKKHLPYKLVRKVAADFMEAHADDFAGFLEEPLEQYAAKIRDTAEWGGQLELTALARAYGVEIKVVQDGRTEVIGPFGEDKKDFKTLWLAYYRHGYGLGEHYNSLRKATAA